MRDVTVAIFHKQNKNCLVYFEFVKYKNSLMRNFTPFKREYHEYIGGWGMVKVEYICGG